MGEREVEKERELTPSVVHTPQAPSSPGWAAAGSRALHPGRPCWGTGTQVPVPLLLPPRGPSCGQRVGQSGGHRTQALSWGASASQPLGRMHHPKISLNFELTYRYSRETKVVFNSVLHDLFGFFSDSKLRVG